mgnify:CR=1 FL=1
MGASKILIVEDEELISLTLRLMLESYDYHVLSTVNNGDVVIQKVIEEEPDIILMDIELMGEKNGIEAAEEVQEVSDTPIIFVTAHPKCHVSQRTAIKEYGYIEKPFNGQELLDLIESRLKKNYLINNCLVN